MPRFNQTGPAGQGPMTGQRKGKCTNFGANQAPQVSTQNETAGDNIREDVSVNNFGFGQRRGGQNQGLHRRLRGRNNS